VSSEHISTHRIDTASEVESSSFNLPIRHDLRWGFLFSLLIAGLTAVVSIAGLLYTDDIYNTAELRRNFVANDVVNLLIGLPILLGSMWLARRGKLIGLLFWPGALFYGLYNYLVYLFALPFSVTFLPYLVIFTASVYTLVSLVAAVEAEVVRQRLNGRVPERFAGGLLIAFGLLFMLRVVGVMVDALANQLPIAGPELVLQVADFILGPALVIGGALLWRRRPLGYVAGAGLLFQASMLFIGLIAILIIQPLVSDASFSLVDVIVVFVMGFICFIPLALFIRGVAKP
jgi:hypothetical protein